MNTGFTGRHMTAIMVAFFAVVMAVNFFMARMAGATFGGVVVENSYVASQHFNRWLGEAAAEAALGWKVAPERTADGRLAVRLTGVPARAVAVRGEARHPLGRAADRTLTFRPDGDGRFVSQQQLPAGRWILRLEIDAAGRSWRTEGDLR